jgi:peptide/nickel transport system substrate-binding protein
MDQHPVPVQPGAETSLPPNQPSIPVATLPAPPKKRHRLLKLFLAALVSILLVIGAGLWWLLYFRHFNFGHKGGNVGVIKAAIFEGNMNHFAPAMESDDATVYMNRQIFEGLVIFQDKTKISPNLVTGWTNPNDNTWIFTLKPGVKFHTGNTLSPKDVVYSYEQLKQNENFNYVTETIASVEAVGANQVKFTTKSVDPILLNRLVDLFIIDSTAQGRAGPQFGSGPYTLKEGTTATSSHIELEAFNDYHGGKPQTKGVQVTVYSEDEEDSVTKAFILGKLNLVAFVPTAAVETAKSLHFQSGSREDPAVYQLAFNTNKAGSPLAKLKVRQAINKTIDVPALLKAIGRDQTGTVADQVLAPSIPGYNPDVSRPAQDLAGAKQLLKEAGYPNGTEFKLTVFNAAKDAGDEIARQLAQIGIKVTIDSRDDIDGIQQDVTNGNLEAFYYAEGTTLLDGSDAFSKLAQGKNYRNPEVDRLQTEANSTLNPNERLNALKQISKILSEDVAMVPLYTNQNQWIMDRAYVMPEDTLVSGLGVYMWKVHL